MCLGQPRCISCVLFKDWYEYLVGGYNSLIYIFTGFCWRHFDWTESVVVVLFQYFMHYVQIRCITLNGKLFPHLGFNCSLPSFTNRLFSSFSVECNVILLSLPNICYKTPSVYQPINTVVCYVLWKLFWIPEQHVQFHRFLSFNGTLQTITDNV